MNIDLTTNFDELLLAAKAKHRMYVDKVDEYRPLYKIDFENGVMGYPPDVQEKINDEYRKWTTWVHENITEHGLMLETDSLGVPTAIIAILAGKK